MGMICRTVTVVRMKARRRLCMHALGTIVGTALLFGLCTQIPLFRSVNRPRIPRKVLCDPDSEWEAGPVQKAMNGQNAHRRDDVTIVTGYFNLGTFRKGFIWKHFSPTTYLGWVQVFQDIENPIVAFFETDEDIAMFKKVRSMFPCNMTKIYQINRTDLWSFSLRDRIHELYSAPEYPKHHPNTVLPEYSCVMHAKYDFIERVTKNNPFNTKYVTWLDLGYFRDVPYNSGKFSLYIPPKFDHSRISYGKIIEFDSRVQTAEEIVAGNLVWIGGGMFLGTMDVMRKWTQSYKQFTEKMLQLGWMSTDQQVLYTMHLPQYIDQSRQGVQLQLYEPLYRYSTWFTLGFLCKEEGFKRKQRDAN